MKLRNIITTIVAILFSLVIVIYENKSEKNDEPLVAYRVYLEGKDIGLIESREKLEDYINLQQEKLKEKYGVDKIHIPNNIDIVKDITYDENISSVETIYHKINNLSPFTIEGYQIKIDKTNSSVYINDENIEEDNDEKIIYLYVLNKEIFVNAVKNVIMSFVSEDDYDAFINEEQLQIETTGELIEDIYLDDEITIKEAYITVTENIFIDEDELTKYLIFGEYVDTETYVVKTGDTIDEIASANEMSVNELLIANSDISSESSLLYVGQELSIGTLDPIFTTIVEKHVVTDQVVKYETTYKYNYNKQTGYSKVLQEGSNGVNRVTQKVKLINGEISTAFIVNSEEIAPKIDKIVEKGGRKYVRGDGKWVWPTNVPYIISSPYGWRWGKLHEGLDICGTGSGSPIYAARDGVVYRIGSNSTSGYFIQIKHDNGYYTYYAHLLSSTGNNVLGGQASSLKYVQVGDYVTAGTRIGDMGSSGFSTGTHLHFAIWNGVPYGGGSTYNPMLFY